MGVCKIQKPNNTGISKHGDTFIKITHNGAEGDEVKYEGDKGDLHINLECEEGKVADDFYVIGAGKLSSDRLVVKGTESGTTLDLNYKDKSVLDNFDATIEDLQNQINSINRSGVDVSRAINYIKFHPLD